LLFSLMKLYIILLMLILNINSKLFEFLEQNNREVNGDFEILTYDTEGFIDTTTFDSFDLNKDSLVSKLEFVESFKSFGGNLDENEVNKFFTPFDLDKDDHLNITEFSNMMASSLDE